MNIESVREKLRTSGGAWIGACRRWLQWNVKNGSTLEWNSTKDVTIPFNQFTELALDVATAAVMEHKMEVDDAIRQATINGIRQGLSLAQSNAYISVDDGICWKDAHNAVQDLIVKI